MNLKFFTNHLPGGWSPFDLEKGIGGSEEAVIMLSNELAKDFDVTVYHTQKLVAEIKFGDVTYLDRSSATCYDDDIFITFKDNTPWLHSAKPKKAIHWTTEIEKPWDLSNVEHIVHISNFHKSRNIWIPEHKSETIPLGIDKSSLDNNKIDKEQNTILYCSSPDRGLEVLLKDWSTIKSKFPEMRLNIAYGFNNLIACSENNTKAKSYVEYMMSLMNQDGITYLGQLSKNDLEEEYWRSQFWILPLQNADSELFCLNAIKSSYCNCIPIVNKIGALRQTVGEYVPYIDFINGKLETIDKGKADIGFLGWSDIVKQYWRHLL